MNWTPPKGNKVQTNDLVKVLYQAFYDILLIES